MLLTTTIPTVELQDASSDMVESREEVQIVCVFASLFSKRSRCVQPLIEVASSFVPVARIVCDSGAETAVSDYVSAFMSSSRV